MLADLVGLIDLVLNGHILADRSLIGAVELPSLRTLRICDGEDIPGLLGLILAPSLHSLLLETLECSEIRELTLLFATSTMPIYPSLRSFAIYLFTINPVTSHHWEEFMCVFPTVTHFTLSHDSINAFLRALNPPRSSALVWPDLHTLTLLKEYGRAQADLLCEAISGRIAAGRPLRRIGLTKEALLEPEVELEWLRAHVEVNECTMIADAEKDDNLAGWVDSAS
jgi:hypothetical protein